MRDDLARRRYVAALVSTDAVLLSAAFVLANLARSSSGFAGDALADPMAIAVVPFLLVVLWLRGAYARAHVLGGPEEYVRVIGSCAYGALFVAGVSYLFGASPLVPRSALLLFWVLATVSIVGGRFLLRRVAYALRARGLFVRRVLVAGASEQGVAIAGRIHGPREGGVEVVGFLDDYAPVGTRLVGETVENGQVSRRQFQVVGHPYDAQELAMVHRCDLVIVVPAALSWESQQALVQLGAADNGLDVRLAPAAFDLAAACVEPAPLGFLPLLRLGGSRIVGVQALLRAALDVALAATLLVAVAPFVGAALMLGRARGVRPLLVERAVVGRDGSPVRLRLLNPMVTDRLLLRGAPALLDVVRGRLALVGPRPIPADEWAQYQRRAGLLRSVLPGLTGPWRLGGPEAPDERMFGDVLWVHNWTIWQHLFVLVQTGRRVWRHRDREGSLARWNRATLRRTELSVGGQRELGAAG